MWVYSCFLRTVQLTISFPFYFMNKNAYCYSCWFYSILLHFGKLWSERTRSLAVYGYREEQRKSPSLKLVQGNGELQVD